MLHSWRLFCLHVCVCSFRIFVMLLVQVQVTHGPFHSHLVRIVIVSEPSHLHCFIDVRSLINSLAIEYVLRFQFWHSLQHILWLFLLLVLPDDFFCVLFLLLYWNSRGVEKAFWIGTVLRLSVPCVVLSRYGLSRQPLDQLLVHISLHLQLRFSLCLSSHWPMWPSRSWGTLITCITITVVQLMEMPVMPLIYLTHSLDLTLSCRFQTHLRRKDVDWSATHRSLSWLDSTIFLAVRIFKVVNNWHACWMLRWVDRYIILVSWRQSIIWTRQAHSTILDFSNLDGWIIFSHFHRCLQSSFWFLFLSTDFG